MDQTAYFAQMRKKRKTEILISARKMFLTEGIAAFNIQQLARNLDISTVTLYKYFKNSDDILKALQKQILQDLQTDSFSDTIPAGKDSLDSLQQLLETFYTEILKRKEDLSLLLLSEWYLPSKEAKTASILLPYINKLEPAFFSALQQAQTEHLLKTNFDISDSLHFFQQMNLTMLEHIALIKKAQYAKKKKELLQQIHQLISSYILSIKK